MATPEGCDSNLPNEPENEVCDIINCVAIYNKKKAQAGMHSFGKKSFEHRFQGK